MTCNTSAPASNKSSFTSSKVRSSSHKWRSKASCPNHVSPVATFSISRDGRCPFTNFLNSAKISLMSASVFARSSFVTFFVGVTVRLKSPAVTVWNSMPSCFNLS